MDKSLVLHLFELYCQEEINEGEQAEDMRNRLRRDSYHIEVDEIEGMYKLRHIIRAEGINILVAEREVFGETVIKHKEWMI